CPPAGARATASTSSTTCSTTTCCSAADTACKRSRSHAGTPRARRRLRSDRLQVLDQVLPLRVRERQLERLRIVLDDRRQVGGAAVVEVRRVLPEAAQGRRAVLLGRAPSRVRRFHPGLGRVVQLVVGERGTGVAGGAAGR